MLLGLRCLKVIVPCVVIVPQHLHVFISEEECGQAVKKRHILDHYQVYLLLLLISYISNNIAIIPAGISW